MINGWLRGCMLAAILATLLVTATPALARKGNNSGAARRAEEAQRQEELDRQSVPRNAYRGYPNNGPVNPYRGYPGYVPPGYPAARGFVPPQIAPAYNTNVPYNYARPAISAGPPAPTASQTIPAATAAPRPVVTPTPVRAVALHQAAATFLATQARSATWDLYEHYEESPEYSATYREMRRLHELIKKTSDTVAAQSSLPASNTALAEQLHEIEVLLQVVQVQTANWSRDADAPRSESGVDLQTQLERMSVTLAELMASLRVQPQDFAAADEEPATIIKARQ